MKYSLSMLLFSFVFTSCIMYQAPINYKKNVNPYKDKFADKLEPGSTLLESSYLSTFEKTADGKYIYKEFYPETKQLIKYQTFMDKNQSTAHGPYKSWMDDGELASEGQYDNGKQTGEWTNWNGLAKTVGLYNQGQQAGTWIGYNSQGNKISEITYTGGKANGVSKHWNEKGELTREFTYSNGEIVSKNMLIEEAFDPNMEYKVVEVQPLFPGCSDGTKEEKKKCAETKMLQFIYSNIKYPPVARENGVEGTAYLKFVVEKDGSITGIKTVRGICDGIKNECERVVRMMPKWEPGMQKGKPVRVQFNLPVKFKLE